MNPKKILKKFSPGWLLSAYHFFLAYAAAALYGFPSKKMAMIGVTGTKGKTTTANFVWAALTGAGFKTGLVGTANVRIGEKEEMNKYHMTMPGPLVMQKIFSDMVKAGCTHCVFETTSEGIVKWRHKGIAYDFAIFTNLTPEHLPSHGGSFENYKAAKGKMFVELMKSARKTITGKELKKTTIINSDSPHKEYFLSFPADKRITYGLGETSDFKAQDISTTPDGVSFDIKGEDYTLRVIGEFNVMNALPAIIAAKEFGATREAIQKGFDALTLIPGRMEKISLGQPYTLFVDYAHEKESMTAVLKTAQAITRNTGGKIIVLLGAEGGGRDKAKRPIMGELAGKMADHVICSNVDPYEDEPLPIAEDIAVAAEAAGKIRELDLFVILDRRTGIRKALELAQPNDVVLITGKGAEQSIVIGGVASPWDDREVVREELSLILKKT
ncbi:MAG: UDP-N-acetylmuramyl-tripeptide synthetase [Patescibacteria group bacterium]|nr:UDP-N-acetylmuramyl-tripeptide synthetase [Patescibacteria group bacterium]